jgi:xanthine dehydrogenase accessory factor
MADSPAYAAAPLAPLEDWPEWPEYGLIDDLLPVLEDWQAAGQRFAVATLVHIAGSSPRPLGSEMAISESGAVAGYVSGGCVEPAVAAEALAAIQDGRPRLLDYGAGSAVLDPRLSCGGRIRILVQPVLEAAAHLDSLRLERSQRQPVLRGFSAAATQLLSDAGLQVPTLRRTPRTRLVLVGSDPIAVALARQAPVFGLETELLRPLGPEQAPMQSGLRRYDRRRLDSMLADLQLDAWTAVYTLMHDLIDDHEVLCHALRSDAYCVGALGSRKKADSRRELLEQEGFSDEVLRRLHTPAGLWIGARNPNEIALSIIGQVLEQRPA